MNITIIGVGYVGLVTGACFAELNNNVLCLDVNNQKIEKLKESKIPFYEPRLEEMVRENYKLGRMNFTTDLKLAVDYGDIIFICVGTPEGKNGNPNLETLYSVVNGIIEKLEGSKLIVIKSTVPVGTVRRVKELLYEKGNNVSRTVELAYNPEFLSEGRAIKDFMIPDRIVLGVETAFARETLTKLYDSFLKNNVPVIMTEFENAEMIKYSSNAFLAMKISYINEIAAICEYYRADVRVVARGIGLDKRIGEMFLRAGAGYGGSCFPKDTIALFNIGEKAGYSPLLVRDTINVNHNQQKRIIEKIRKSIGRLKGATIAVLGVSFKPDTDDVREAPSAPVVKYLLNKKARVKIYDPKGMENFKELVPEGSYCSDAYEACRDSDCVVLFTDWDEFLELDYKHLKEIVKQPIIIDLRNMLEPELIKNLGFAYQGIGVI